MGAIPTHTLHIHQKPRLGSNFLRAFPVFQYRHRLTDFGGCDSASFIVAVGFNEAEWLFENCIGNAGRMYVDDPVEPIFDGFISRITYEIGDKIFTRGLDDMFNQTEIEVYDVPSATTTTVGAVVNVAASQAIYGLKRGRINGETQPTASTGLKNAIKTALSVRAAWPLSSFSQNPSGGLSVKIEMRGWYAMWDWEIYTNVAVGSNNPWVVLRGATVDTSASAPLNAPFIYSTGAGAGAWSALIQTNNAFSMSDGDPSGQTYLQFIESIVAGGGTAGAPWVCGITKFNNFDPNTNGRRVYYRPARTSVFYYQRGLTEPGVFRDVFGRKIDPWRVEADRVVQATDVLFGWNSQGQDPRATYIVALDYDAEAQNVSYVGADDITPQGIFGARTRFKVRGRGQNRSPVRFRI
jgi:hypothetical protein